MPTHVVKLNTALSNKPYFIKVDDVDSSIDRVVTKAISSLRGNGKPLEADQLEQLYDSHQMFNGNQVVEKGSLLAELDASSQTIGQQEVQLYNLNLIASHAGGY